MNHVDVTAGDFPRRLLDVWRRHDDLLIYLLDHVPARGLVSVVPRKVIRVH